jgi:RNA polymerase sigma-70 factor (ECF subfamily)
VNKNLPGYDSAPLPQERGLVRSAKSGDSQAFAQLYDAYLERVYRYIYFRVNDDQTAEDLTSQVFLKAWENFQHYQAGSSPFIAWLYTIARNQVIDYYRTRKPTIAFDEIVSLPAKEESVDEQVQTRFKLQAMRDALQFLTEDQQEVLILRFIAGLGTQEIARAMHKAEGAVRALQMRALQTLSKYMVEKELK